MKSSKLAPWNVLESAISYEDPWLRIRTDRCRTSQGIIVEPYHVLECSTWVNVVALTSEGRMILVREYRHGAGQILLGLPGGAVEGQDENPLAAIQRELREETGYSSEHFFALGQSYANLANQNNRVWSFLALDVRKSQEQNLDETEDIEIVLQDFVDFSQQTWDDAIPLQALHLATIGLASHFILRSKLPQLQEIRARLLQALSS
jgi:ADP-ribose pyrophosphatase